MLSLPTVGPLLLRSLISQDMFLAGTIVLLLGVLTVVGTFISDLVLMWIDPAHPPAAAIEAADARSPVDHRRWRDRGGPPRNGSRSRASSSSPGGASAATGSRCVSGVVVILFYLVAVFADFLATTDPHDTDARAQLHRRRRRSTCSTTTVASARTSSG